MCCTSNVLVAYILLPHVCSSPRDIITDTENKSKRITAITGTSRNSNFDILFRNGKEKHKTMVELCEQ